MKVVEIKEIEISINFKLKFKHNTKERSSTESFFVKLKTDTGLVSYGEGCPRSYVTGEDINSCREFLSNHLENIIQINSFLSLNQFVTDYDNAISENPAAWCAIEIALLDLIAKERRCSVEELFNLNKPRKSHIITAVLGIDSLMSFSKKLLKYRLYGLSDFKIKLSGDNKKDKRVLSLVRLSGVLSSHIRLDANNLWGSDNECIDTIEGYGRYFWAIEEPLKEKSISSFVSIHRKTGKKIILDESFLNYEDIEEIKSYPDIFLVNLRISKMGGIIRSLKIIEEFKKYGFKFILGTHVGETSLLNRASLLIAENYEDLIQAMEGAYSTHLLQIDPAVPNIKFEKKGLLKIENLSLGRFGFGVKFNE